MSHDSILYRRPWDNHRESRLHLKPSQSSWLYSLHPAPESDRRALKLVSSAIPGGYERMDLGQASSLNSQLLGLRSQEREQLVDLNDRFATYIEKVRHLELQNRALLAELEGLRRRRNNPSRLQGLYEGEVRTLRAMIESENEDKAQMETERDYLHDVHKQMKIRLEEEVQRRVDAGEVLQRVRKEADLAALSNCDAEANVASLCDEISFLRKVFAEEHTELQVQLQVVNISVEEVQVARPDLSVALRDIRSQYERLAGKNMQAAEDWYRGKCASVAEVASKNNEAAHAIREETLDYRRRLQSRSSEIEALRNVIDSLNKQLAELEETQVKEVEKYQLRINELERDIHEAKQEMGRYLKDYQDLLNVKMALDIEIAAYRKLLEGEEIRLSYPYLPAVN
ncbi:neurofilament light polypeptide [Dunckerocampus dactyliophorus]|uniref:neurofilament light polypeptide n=1 Tax=Dunckerocampus dactyliophorus TaxID=161453 RepID=UPI002404D537|nr:neurofilament light polypeptide [Dunckerocampus dactyliophorus]